MFAHNGNTIKELVVQGYGRTDFELFCWYRYKDECEPEVNKVKYPNKEDRWYEDYMYLSTVNEAKKSGADVEIVEHMLIDRLEWNEEYSQYAIKKEEFGNKEDYYNQFKNDSVTGEQSTDQIMYKIDGINDCDENCELQVGISHGNCYAECLKCGGSYIETEHGLICTDCESDGTDI